ncbi:TetR/AcrR family transcriptional regulator [Mycolicibacter sinensis]|nr:TetR/AcrR family transcriptional regulator [Mycolicibacter algericus]
MIAAPLPAPARERAAHLGPERRRPQVLDAALAIAASSGTAAVTVGSIAGRLGVTRPVVYACFADRVTLIEALVERERNVIVQGLLDALHAARGDDPETAFVAGYRALLRTVEEHPDTWRLIFTSNPDPSVAGVIATARHEMAASATRWIGPALNSWWGTAELDRKLPVLIELFMSSSEAASRSLLDPENDWTADDLGEFYGRIICSAFRAA